MTNLKLVITGILMLNLVFCGIASKAVAAVSDVIINPLSETCAFNNTGTCAYTPNPLTINSGDSVVWHNNGAVPHTATSDALGNSVALTPPVAPANDWSTELLLGGEFSSTIGPFNTAVNQTKPYHCSLHASTMGGTLMIVASGVTTTTIITTTTRPTTTTRLV